jgi:glycosyltransferase involved in cell wall biosynthesis
VQPETKVDASGAMRAVDDLGRRAILGPLLDALQPESVLICWIDQEPGGEAANVLLRSDATVASCRAEGLEDALDRGGEPDVIWLRGHPSWHTMRVLAASIVCHVETRSQPPPVLLFEGGPSYAMALDGVERAKEGVRLGLSALAARIDPEGTVLWCAPGRGAGAYLPSSVARSLDGWLGSRRVLLDALTAVHERGIELATRNLALFELLDRSQHDANAVVRSVRFRIGTRVVRLGRSMLRREVLFRAPRDILARKPIVDQWRSRLAREGRPREGERARDALRVTYVLPELRLSGGALVVLQLVAELRELGLDARIVAAKDTRREVFRWRRLVHPKVYGSVNAMMREMHDTDILVATHWTTARWVRDLVDAGRARHAAYFLQDYEVWFHPEADVQARARVKQTYDLIPDKIVTSEWLRGLLEQDGHDARKIPLGLDLGFFYPRTMECAPRGVVLAMARPRTPRRGFDTVVAALAKVHDAQPSVEIVLFGEHLGGLTLPFPYRAEGVVTDPEHMARLYSEARVHFDGSDFQAFGLPGLEAMGCGAVSVLTDVGGVREFARDQENCVLVAPRDAQAAARAILELLTDDGLHRRLREGAFETVRQFSMQRAARDTVAALQAISTSTEL